MSKYGTSLKSYLLTSLNFPKFVRDTYGYDVFEAGLFQTPSVDRFRRVHACMELDTLECGKVLRTSTESNLVDTWASMQSTHAGLGEL